MPKTVSQVVEVLPNLGKGAQRRRKIISILEKYNIFGKNESAMIFVLHKAEASDLANELNEFGSEIGGGDDDDEDESEDEGDEDEDGNSYQQRLQQKMKSKPKKSKQVNSEKSQKNGGKDRFVSLHGDMSLSARTTALDSFRTKDAQVLVCTDVAARGIDIDVGVSLVINTSVGLNIENYVHRCGRTGRPPLNAGVAYTLVVKSDEHLAPELLQVLQASGCTLIPPDLREWSARELKKRQRISKSVKSASVGGGGEGGGGSRGGGGGGGGGSRDLDDEKEEQRLLQMENRAKQKCA